MSSGDSPRRIELLAPARTAAIGREAIVHGADAVYIGAPAFGARHNAANTLSDIAALVDVARRYHARIYVTLNTILDDAEIEAARRLAWQCWDAGVDALIIQDMGLLEVDLPPIELHAPTQCDIRTAATARFLADVGFSQLVLARELTLAEIAALRAAVPASSALEFFIHGALCVAYSGQCYLSHAHTGRSANRGDCSQACRLPYQLVDGQGRVVAFQQHLLSLKDNNQSANLEALLDAGISSLKIEGRYKEGDYVKNVTGHYRRSLDALFERRPEYAAASSGRTQLLFTPDPAKTFQRGATDYFVRGRQPDIGAFATPAYIGIPIGSVTRVGADWFEVDSNVALANGDGLAFVDRREVRGLQVNRAESVATAEAPLRWRLWPNAAGADLAHLRPGTALSRNRDQLWEQALARPSAQRRIAVRAEFSASDDGYTLRLQDSDGIDASATLTFAHQAATQPEQAMAQLRQQLSGFGNSDFELTRLDISCSTAWFVPNSLLKALRRQALEALAAARLAAYRRPARLAPSPTPAVYPQHSLSYLANIYNAQARAFYARHGVVRQAAAYEAHEETGPVALMITRQCLRYAFSLCPRQAKGVIGVQGQLRAEPMVLNNGKERLTLKFDCQACEMHVIGKIKKSVLAPPRRG